MPKQPNECGELRAYGVRRGYKSIADKYFGDDTVRF